VIVAAWRTDERAEQLAFSQPYLQNVIRAVKRRESDFGFPELLDGRLKDLPMGVVRDYAYGEALETFENHPRYTENTLPQVLIALTHGRIAFTIGDEIALRYHIRTYFGAEADAFEFSRPLALQGLRMAVSRSNPHHERIITDFDAAIADMRADGTLERLSAPYAGRDRPAD
jgi:ABC-type amino acid transport substrate-binding protein